MNRKPSVISYVISFFNPIVSSFILITLGACYLVGLHDTKTGITTQYACNEVFYSGHLLGVYLNFTASLAYYYNLRKQRLTPRWWKNLIFILFGYLIIPITGVIVGHEELTEAASVKLLKASATALPYFVLGFILISCLAKKTTDPEHLFLDA